MRIITKDTDTEVQEGASLVSVGTCPWQPPVAQLLGSSLEMFLGVLYRLHDMGLGD